MGTVYVLVHIGWMKDSVGAGGCVGLGGGGGGGLVMDLRIVRGFGGG